MRETRALRDSLVPADLERLKSKLLLAVTLGGERPADRMQRIGRQWTYQRRYSTLQEELDRINAVTISDLRHVADQWPLAPITTGRMVPATPASESPSS